MNKEQIISAIAELLMHVPGQLLKEAVDIVESRHPDPITEFEIRQAAFNQAEQARLDARFPKE